MIRIEYLKDVHSPHHMRGNKGDIRQIEPWWAEMLTEGSAPYARYCDDPQTGEPIIYPPEVEPETAAAESAVAVHHIEPSEIHTSKTEDLANGIAEQGASQSVEEAPPRKSADAGMGGRRLD